LPFRKELPIVEQIVPGTVCATCDVCCRFPEMDSALRPYFTRNEIQAAISAGVSADAFPDHAGSKISLVPDVGNGGGYRCPAFQSATGQCGIYESRPLDCRLYPVAVMWDRAHAEVVAGWDIKCPFMIDKLEAPESHAYLSRTLSMLETEELASTFVANPQLIGAFQEDVLKPRPLERISQALRRAGSESILTPFPLLTPFHPFTLADRGWFEQLLLTNPAEDHPLAAYSFAYHYIWRELFTYEWVRLNGHTCLFATTTDGIFLALPPVGPNPSDVIDQVFDVLGERNCGSGVSRIENVPLHLAERCESLGYRVQPKAGDYVYLQDDLAGLKGDRYKSQRASYNHCVKHSGPGVRPYRAADMSSCLRLFQSWQQNLETRVHTGLARDLAADSASAHRVALCDAEALGLVGCIAEVGGQVSAYTLGYPLNDSTFCILLEITDRQVQGLSQYIFREFCRSLSRFQFINTMDDSGLEGLRRAKESYHPEVLVNSFIVTPSGDP
jgi:uncharacterized protein